MRCAKFLLAVSLAAGLVGCTGGGEVKPDAKGSGTVDKSTVGNAMNESKAKMDQRQLEQMEKMGMKFDPSKMSAPGGGAGPGAGGAAPGGAAPGGAAPGGAAPGGAAPK